jgi:hypothetical protein
MASASRLLFLAVLLALAPALRALDSGQPVPDVAFTDSTGKPHRLSAFRGKTVVLEWLNPACPYVQRHYRSGNLPTLQAEAAAAGIVWLQVNSNAMGDLDPKATAEWQRKQNVVATAYIRDVSGALGRHFCAGKTPHFAVVAPDGVLAYQGAIDDQPSGSVATVANARNYVKAALAALKAGQRIDPSRTEAYGCAVKYGTAP